MRARIGTINKLIDYVRPVSVLTCELANPIAVFELTTLPIPSHPVLYQFSQFIYDCVVLFTTVKICTVL